MPDAVKKKVVLGVCGSIAAYKAVELLRALQKAGLDVWPVLTASACDYISPLTFRSLSGHPVPHGPFAGMDPDSYVHLGLAENAGAFVVAPCTANTLSRLAHGMCDEALSAAAVSAPEAKLVLAPAMNARMWRHPATKENVETLRRRGAVFVGPGTGELGCGETGPGRLADVGEIARAVLEAVGVLPGKEQGNGLA